MKEKTQYEALVEELQKIGENFTDAITELGDILAKILPDIEIPEEEEDTWEMKCPFEYNDAYYWLTNNGNVEKCFFNTEIVDKPRFYQGSIFKTRQAAELEAKRRNLLTRFRAFRDECNGDWKPDWSSQDKKWEIDCDYQGLKPLWINKVNGFPTFGHFENEEDCKRAIELFGDEIKELFVDCEV
nr:MAG TPA: hypothetical protein [Caudoviricetes sp.]